jgi:K+-sensing histidine kinase KdpD
MDPRNAFGPGFILRAKALPGDGANTAGSTLGPQDAWLIPFVSGEGRVEAYVSLAQPDPSRLPDADELRFFQAAFDACTRYMSRLETDSDAAQSVGKRIRETEMEAVALSGFRETLCTVTERLRSGLANLESYAQTLLDYGDAMPKDEPIRVARLLVEESQDMREEALLISDLAEFQGEQARATGETVEFSDLYAELLQFLLHRAETRGVALNGPPLQGGLYIDRPAALMRRLLALVSNELLGSCSSGDELTLSAWQGGNDIHIDWRASGRGVRAPSQDEGTARWIAAQAIAAALGGSLRESTFGADNRAVSLTIPLAGGAKEPETRVA